ncbi:MAG: hypothetical protein RIT28_1930 [Pseudomonadota bacterium]
MILLLSLLGCATMGGLGAARTLDAGQTRASVGFELGWVDSQPFVAPLARLDVGARHGVTDRLEVGVQLGAWPLLIRTAHLGLDTKLALHRAPSLQAGVDVSMGLSLQADGVSSAGLRGQAWTAQVPLYVGLNQSEDVQWQLVPRVAVQHLRSDGAAPVTKALFGMSVGMAIQSERATLLPNVGLLWSSNPANQLKGLTTLQGGVSVQLNPP